MPSTSYRVTFKAHSGVHLRPDHKLNLDADLATSSGYIQRIQFASDYRDDLPELLTADVFLKVPDDVAGDPFEVAIEAATQCVHTFQLMSVLFNAAVHEPNVTGIYTLRPGGQYRQQTLPENRPHGDINIRQTQADTLHEMLAPIPNELPERLRVALMLYDYALCALHPFRILEVALRLYPGIENLTMHIMRRLQGELGLSDDEHAAELKIDTTKDDWRYQYRGKIRRDHIFTQDAGVFRTIREVRNDYEHASANPEDLRNRLKPVLLSVLQQFRQALLSELPLSVHGRALAEGDPFKAPLGNWPTVLVASGTFDGDPALFSMEADRIEFDQRISSAVFLETEFMPADGKRKGSLRTTIAGEMSKLPEGATGRIESTLTSTASNWSDTPQPPLATELFNATFNGQNITDRVRPEQRDGGDNRDAVAPPE